MKGPAMSNIVCLFKDAARSHPEQVAIIHREKPITFKELESQVGKTATYFNEKGIGKGDRVLVFVPMSIDLYRIVLALFSCGATAVFLDEWVSKKRMELCCEIADCKGFIGVTKARIFSLFSKELRRIPVKLKLRKVAQREMDIVPVSGDDSALITFTTGSTGRPKAANRTHGFLHAQFSALLDEIQPTSNDVDMPVLPIVLFTNLGVGCTSIIADFKMTKPEKMNARFITKQILRHRVNRISASPYFISRLSDYLIQNKISTTQVQKIFTGGAPVFPLSAELYKIAFPSTKIKVVYGSTEVEPISSIEASELVGRKADMRFGLAVGTVFHKTQVRIISITEEDLPNLSEEVLNSMVLEAGLIGEIIVSGDHVLKHYYNSESAFRSNKIIVGNTLWHRTGDSGLIVDDQLYLTGRCKQLIRHNGELLSPFIIENKLTEIDGVEIGTLIDLNNKLHLVLETSMSQLDLSKQISSIPHDYVHCLPKIPRDPRHNSKIDYERLKELIHTF